MTRYLIQAVAILALVIVVSLVVNKITNRQPAKAAEAGVVSKPLDDANYRSQLITAYVKSQNLSTEMQKQELDLCMKDKDCSDTRAKLQAAVAETNRLADEIQKTKGFKPGTSFRVDSDKGTVDYVEPAATK